MLIMYVLGISFLEADLRKKYRNNENVYIILAFWIEFGRTVHF